MIIMRSSVTDHPLSAYYRLTNKKPTKINGRLRCLLESDQASRYNQAIIASHKKTSNGFNDEVTKMQF